MRWLAACFSAVLIGFSSLTSAFSYDAGYYSVYEAPGSGNTTIIYIVPHSMFLLLATQPATPLSFMPNATGYQAVLYADGSLGTFTQVNYTANNMAALGATLSSYKLIGGDFNGDKNTDLLLQGTGARNSVVLTTDANGNAQIFYNFGTRLNSAVYSVSTGDVDLNGTWDVVAKNNSTGVSTTYYSNFAGYFDAGTPASGPSSTTLVGAINGKFRVDESGNSTYSIDILTAAGTAGVAPHVSLNYSSGAGDGVMGRGWSIGGLSAITRCRQTLAQDGNATGITLTSSDRFCLDGQRLILYSGTYGAPGSVYRTEIDSYAVVTAVGGATGNPSYFTVVRKDGSISYYGNGSNSQLVLNGNGPVLTWSLSRFQDGVGNPILFSYTANASTNEQLIARIDFAYGSNTAATSNSSTYLSFSYEARPDASSGYIAGSKIQRTQRLTTITSYNNNNEIRHYTLGYRPIDSTHYQSYVQNLFECAGASCLSPTTFNWNLNNGGFQAVGTTVATISSSAALSLRTMDINGDGKPDLVYQLNAGNVPPFKYYYQLWNGSGYASSVQFASSSSPNFNIFVLDQNNDGFQDLLMWNGQLNSNLQLYLGGSNGLSYSGDSGLSVGDDSKDSVLDINSDGLPDYVNLTNLPSISLNFSQRSISGGNWSYSFGAQQTTVANLGSPSCQFNSTNLFQDKMIDFNGDGKLDLPIWVYFGSGYGVGCFATGVLVGDGHGAFTLNAWTLVNAGNSSPASQRFQDLNGDGLPDTYGAGTVNGSTNWNFAFNTGNGWGATNVLGPALGSANISQGLQFIDYNNDGYPDAVYTSGSNLAVMLYNPTTQSYGTAFTTTLPSSCSNFIDADGDGNVDALCIQNNGSSNVITLYKSADAGSPGNKIIGINNGLGNSTTISYKPLTDPTVYTKGNDANNAIKWTGAPVFDIVAPSYVVSSVSSTDPTANALNPNQVNYSATATVSYQYAGLKMQASGRGSLGFASITTTDQQSLVVTNTTYNQVFPFIGQPLTTTQTSSSGLVFKSSTNTQAYIPHTGTDGTIYYQVYTPTITEQNFDPIGGWQLNYVVTQTANPDSWGNLPSITTSVYNTQATYIGNSGAYLTRKVVSNTYGNSTYTQQFGRLSSSVVTQQRSGASDIVRTSNFTYYGSGNGNLQGLLASESVTAADGTTSPTKYYQYDAFGNKWCVSVGSDSNLASNCTPTTTNRYEITDYDSAGRFVVDKQSPFSNSSGWANQITEKVVSRNAMGLPTQVNGLNGLITSYNYDALGREFSRSDNTGAGLTTTYALGGSVAGAQYNVTTTANTGASAIEYFDALGRSIAKWKTGFNGAWVTSETEYDNLGRVLRQSAPHYNTDQAYWATNAYNAFRIKSQAVPATGNTTATTSISYAFYYSLIKTTQNALGQTRMEVYDSAGELISVTDYLGGTISYTYNAAGQLIQTATRGAQNGTTATINSYVTYDGLGRKVGMRDTDKGTWFYDYNAFGDLADQYKVTAPTSYAGTLAQAQASSSVSLQGVQFSYDKRGRTTNRLDVGFTPGTTNSTVQAQGISTWNYDTAANGIGQLAQETTNDNFSRTYAYDSLGRPSSTLHSDGNGSYLLTVTYDSYGRPQTNTDALGTGSGTQNSYNAYGYLQSVSDIATGVVLNQINAMDARGSVTSAILGNGATSTFSYDAGSGLLTNQTTQTIGTASATVQNLSYTWDVLGNQTSRQDQGVLNAANATYKNLQQSFCYDGLNRLIKTYQGSLNGSCSGLTAAQQDQQYDGFGNIIAKTNVGIYTYSTTQPHQLQSTSDGVSYTYDTVGNLLSDTSGRTLQYTVADRPSLITQGSNSISFLYGPDRDYFKRTDTTSSGTTTTYHIGNVEKVVKSDGSYDMKRYLAGVALWNHHFSSAGAQTSVDQQYMYKDALGSVVLITDNIGTVKQENAFNAWGQRVNNTDWQTVLPGSNFLPVSQQFTTASFTGQDALDAVGLIDYGGGRIYDPRLGRFVQADPVVQDDQDTQAYNRYAYVLNSPLMLTDPSGFCSLACSIWHGGENVVEGAGHAVGDALTGATKGIVNALGPQVSGILVDVGSYFCTGAYVACVAAGNYVIARDEGASFDQGLKAGAIAGASAYAFSEVGSAYGNPDANNSWVSTTFGVQQGGGEWMAMKVVTHGVVGGVMSVVSGGKFGNGFVSAGFGEVAGLGMNNYGVQNLFERVAISAIAGGTASELTGGKFANGALTAAMVQIFNACLHGEGGCGFTRLQSLCSSGEGGGAACTAAVNEQGGDAMKGALVGFEKLTTLPMRIFTEWGLVLDKAMDYGGLLMSAHDSQWGDVASSGFGIAYGQAFESLFEHVPGGGSIAAVLGKFGEAVNEDAIKAEVGKALQ